MPYGPLLRHHLTIPSEEVPAYLKSLRQRLKMSQEQFANSIGVTVSTMNRWEKGHLIPSRFAWKAIQELNDSAQGIFKP